MTEAPPPRRAHVRARDTVFEFGCGADEDEVADARSRAAVLFVVQAAPPVGRRSSRVATNIYYLDCLGQRRSPRFIARRPNTKAVRSITGNAAAVHSCKGMHRGMLL
jgi:hypothetical protein